MFDPLSNRDLAKLHAKFIVPIVVDQMLNDEEPLDDVAEYAINEILSELCPDTALLCIAMCALHIAKEARHLPMGKALGIEAEKITDEYGPLWLRNEQNPDSLGDNEIERFLIHIPEDLEALHDLLEATMLELDETHCTAAILCDILSLQASEHKEIAELELLGLNLQPENRHAPQNIESHGDNIIAFAHHHRNKQRAAQQ